MYCSYMKVCHVNRAWTSAQEKWVWPCIVTRWFSYIVRVGKYAQSYIKRLSETMESSNELEPNMIQNLCVNSVMEIHVKLILN